MPQHNWSLRINKQDDPVCSKCGITQSTMAATGKFICGVEDAAPPPATPLTPSEYMHKVMGAVCELLEASGVPRWAVMLNDGKIGCAGTNAESHEDAANWLEEAATNYRLDAKTKKN